MAPSAARGFCSPAARTTNTLSQLASSVSHADAPQGYHFVGANAVGSVLDGDMRVRGFSNLRVVDSSAIPDIPRNAGPASSVYMLAEFMAERIIAAARGGTSGGGAGTGTAGNAHVEL
jgi:choline dehydrogenase-like flavoprotein